MRINSLAQLQELRGNLRIYCRVKPAGPAEERVVVVRDKAFAGELRQHLSRAIDEGSREILADTWQRAPRLQRLINWAAYGLVRLMIGIAGYGNHH